MQPQIGRRLEQRWPYYFFYGRLIRQHQEGEGGWPRAEVTQRRRRRGGDPEEETRRKEEEGGGTTLKSYNPNTEGGE